MSNTFSVRIRKDEEEDSINEKISLMKQKISKFQKEVEETSIVTFLKWVNDKTSRYHINITTNNIVTGSAVRSYLSIIHDLSIGIETNYDRFLESVFYLAHWFDLFPSNKEREELQQLLREK